MNSKLLLTIALATVCSSGYAAEQAIDSCMTAVQKQLAGGHVIKLEKIQMDKKPFFEIEAKDSKGIEWEFICSAETGKIIKKEMEVSSASDAAFSKLMKISLDDAKAIALKAHAGTITDIEFEIEDNGNPVYEFEITTDKGVEMKITVDAVSGKIIETAIESWQAGREDDR
jgi:uncharacterized membrane protein YkoI